jgi:hypothetical protein
MFRIRLLVLGVTLVLMIGCGSSIHPADSGEGKTIEGLWEVTSVQRERKPDPLQVGAQMIFTGKVVEFHPKAVQVADGTS